MHLNVKNINIHHIYSLFKINTLNKYSFDSRGRLYGFDTLMCLS